MQNALTVFNYQDREVRTVMQNGEPWWIVNDVCEILEISNPRDALNRLEEDEVGSTDTIDSMGRKQTVNTVNEPGLYSLILASRKPEAKPFKRWITHEVIPSIRKNGYYIAPKAQREIKEKFSAELREVHNIFKTSKALAKALGLDSSQQILTANRLTKEATGFDAVEKFNVLLPAPVNAARMLSATEVGRELNPPMTAQNVNLLLMDMGLQSKIDGKWVGHPDHQTHWYKKMVDGNGTRFQLVWYDTVIQMIQAHMEIAA